MNITLTRQADPFSVASRRAANDGFRCSLTGGAVLVSAGVVTLGREAHARIIAAVRAFDDFDTDDPFDVHDIGDLEVATGDPKTDRDSELVFFRIDRPPAACTGPEPASGTCRCWPDTVPSRRLRATSTATATPNVASSR